MISAALRRWLVRTVEPTVYFALFAVLALGVIWGATMQLIAAGRAGAESTARQSSRELVETYEAQIVRNFGAIDQALRIVKYAYETVDKRKRKQFSLLELKEKGLLPSSLVFDIHIADQRGDVAAIAANGPAEKVTNVADRPYFRIHLEHDTGVAFVGKAQRNRSTGHWTLQFSRRLNAVDGSFDGIVVVAVEPGYFTSAYEFSRLGAHGVIGLLGQDGEFRVKRSGDDISSGQVVDYAAATRGTLTPAGDGVLLTNPWDGIRRYTIARQLHAFPLTAIVGLSEQEQLGPFYQHRRNYLLQAAAASALLIVIVLALGRLTWQLTKSRRRIRRIQKTYYAASEASLDAFFLLLGVHDASGHVVDFVFTDTNTRGEELTKTAKSMLLGKTLCEIYPKSRDNGLLDDLAAVAQTRVNREKEWKNAMPDAAAEWLYRQVVPVEDGVVVIVRDISERKRLEKRIQYQATHDILTCLPNRHLLRERLQSAIASAARF